MELQKGIQSQKKNSVTLLSLLLMFFVLWGTMPIVSYYCSAYIAMVLFLALFVLLFLGSRIQANKIPILIIPVVLYLVLQSLDLLIIQRDDPFYSIWNVFISGFSLLSGYLVIVRGDKQLIRRLVFVLIITYVITAITTYVGNLYYPQASRIMTADSLALNTYYPFNIGSFGFVYSLVLLHPLFVYFLRSENRNLFAVAVSVISGLCIVESAFTTAALLFLASCIVYFFPPHGDKSLMKRRLRFIILFLIVVFLLLPVILNWVSEWSILEESSEKIADIANLLQGKDTTGEDTELRQDHYLMSWKLFLENPILGSSFFSSKEGGGHSFFIDLLGRWGLFGLAIILWLGYCLWKWFHALSQKQTVVYISALTFVMVIILQILNPKFWTFELGFAIPLLLFTITKQQETKEIAV